MVDGCLCPGSASHSAQPSRGCHVRQSSLVKLGQLAVQLERFVASESVPDNLRRLTTASRYDVLAREREVAVRVWSRGSNWMRVGVQLRARLTVPRLPVPADGVKAEAPRDERSGALRLVF